MSRGYATTLWTAATTLGTTGGLTGAAVLRSGGLLGNDLTAAALTAALAGAGAGVLQSLALRRGGVAWIAANALGSALGWVVALGVLGVAAADLHGAPSLALAAGAIAGCIAAIVQSWWLAPQGIPARPWVLWSALAGAAAAGLLFAFSSLAMTAVALAVPGLTMGLVLEAFRPAVLRTSAALVSSRRPARLEALRS